MGVILLGKIKIHEIAKKLGVNSKDVLEKAQELGLDVKTHMSSVDESEAKKIEAKFSNNNTKKCFRADEQQRKAPASRMKNQREAGAF